MMRDFEKVAVWSDIFLEKMQDYSSAFPNR